jgi:hypothetical protein
VLSRFRRIAGALLYDWPSFERHVRSSWPLIHNRHERIEVRDGGVRCRWQFTTDLYLSSVFPSTGRRLMRRAFGDWPIAFAEAPREAGPPLVTFIIGHRGVTRWPHLRQTLRSIAGQKGAAIECIVVEQSNEREIEGKLPPWVRYIHTPLPQPDFDYARSWTLNVGARAASGEVLILHDNDILVPARYAAEVLRRAREGWDFLDLKRFTFYLQEDETKRAFDTSELRLDVSSTIVQNLQGASVAARRDAYVAIGGFDESFVGWGGEDVEFWERAELDGRVWGWGSLPFLHLFHGPQREKLRGNQGAGVKRWREVVATPPRLRIERLRGLDWGRTDKPTTWVQPETVPPA